MKGTLVIAVRSLQAACAFCAIGLGAVSLQAQSRAGDGPYRLERVAAGQGSGRYTKAVMAPGGAIFALTQRPRQLVRIRWHAARLTATPVALPPTVFSPAALAMDAGDLLVLDPGRRSVHRMRGGEALTEVGSFDVGDATDLCAMRGRIYAYRRREPAPVAVYSPAGRLLAAFGRPFGSGSSARRESMSQGSLLCDPETGSLVVAARLTGEIRAYSANGRALWGRTAPGVRAVIFKEQGEHGVTLTSAPGGSHELLGLGKAENGRVLAQYGIQRPGHPGEYGSVETCRLSIGTGEPAANQKDLPGFVPVAEGWVLSADPARSRVALFRLLHPGR